ncbi:MAG: type II secretion system protein [Phycisphaerales bacterium]
MIPRGSGRTGTAHPRGRWHRSGYTLVELLIVAAIVLTLAGILLVVVRKIVQLIHTLFGPALLPMLTSPFA